MSERQITGADAQRFWSHVDKSNGPQSCWIWTGRKNHGYGVLSFGKANVRAHRISAMIAGLPVGGPVNLVCHKCENRACVNPAHLFIGTAKDNTWDAMNKGRLCAGERHPNARLSESDVREIRSLPIEKLNCAELSKRFGVSRSTIGRAISGAHWKHVDAATLPTDFRSRVCRNGHEVNEDNVRRRKDGARVCRLCEKTRRRSAVDAWRKLKGEGK